MNWSEVSESNRADVHELLRQEWQDICISANIIATGRCVPDLEFRKKLVAEEIARARAVDAAAVSLGFPSFEDTNTEP